MQVYKTSKLKFRVTACFADLILSQHGECTEPHKMGALTKQGAIFKNWKNRYFVVNPDFSVSYYATEEVK